MAKRRPSFGGSPGPPAKREKRDNGGLRYPVIVKKPPPRLTNLSDEVILKILPHLSMQDVVCLQQTCRRLSSVTRDSYAWRQLYFNQFISTRSVQLPLAPESRAQDHSISQTLTDWLDEDSLAQPDIDKEWKRRFKVRHKWSKGLCQVREFDVTVKHPEPHQLVCLHDGIVYVVDTIGGLRAFSAKNGHELLAKTSPGSRDSPTCLAADFSLKGDTHQVVVGYGMGHCIIYQLDRKTKELSKVHRLESSSTSSIEAVAYHSPYLFTFNRERVLILYQFTTRPAAAQEQDPEVLQEMSSTRVAPPYHLSLRVSTNEIAATIAFGLRGGLHGEWIVSLQELRLSLDGELLSSHSATPANPPNSGSAQSAPGSRSATPLYNYSIDRNKPTTVCYTHPYLLLAHTDNTLSAYFVESTADRLAIGPPTCLFGHTSGVGAAHVGSHGTAVSVSLRGDDVRIWEFEGVPADLSVRVNPELDLRGPHAESLKAFDYRYQDGFPPGWVGFDEEKVVVLRNPPTGNQALVVYDFSQ